MISISSTSIARYSAPSLSPTTAMAEHQGKSNADMIERTTTTETQMHTSKGGAPLMRSKVDDLSVWQSARLYKRVGFIAMAAAFCAALDGYRETLYSIAFAGDKPLSCKPSTC